MINSIGPPAPTTPAVAVEAVDRRPKTETQPAATPKAEPPADITPHAPPPKADALRLVIEQNEHVFVYKLVDRETGKVITSIPRSEVGRMAESPSYRAGGVVSTTV